jgi:hypothetical protein
MKATRSRSLSGGWPLILDGLQFTAVIFIAAFLQVGLFYVQLKYMRDGLRDAKIAAYAARDSVKHAETTAVRQLRAYVFPKTSKISNFNSDGIIQIIVVFINSGQTPAYNFSSNMQVVIDDFHIDKRHDFNIIEPKEGSKVNIGAGGESNIIYRFQISVDQRTAVKSGTKAIFIFGKVIYKDTFGENRWTTFRLYYGGNFGCPEDGTLANAEQGNESD